ncbi:MAG: EAL domain-containing protein [Eubacteriales bacterium]|nr:EAL domain-containing protein [Eubacteriales bacterium]
MEKGVELAEFALLLRKDGKPLDKIVNTESFKIDNEPVQSGILKQILSSEAETSVARAILDGKSETAVFRFGTEEYVLALNALGEENGNLFVMCAYKISVIYGEGYGLMTSILATLAGLALAIAVLTATILISRIASDRKIYNLEMLDAVLNCATPKKFQKDLEEVLKRHKTVGFAITSLKINNYAYVYEKFGDDAAINLAKFASGAIKHALFVDETFAYSGEGEFLLLLYFKDRKSFTDRLNGLYLRLASFTGLENDDYKVSASFSVYVVEKDLKQTPKQMIDKLKLVKDSTTVTIGSFSANFYEDMLRENRIRKAEIEGKMENALENSEFHLFYQPKYNLLTKRMDGSEILIRWYDPKLESYRVPSVFLPVFEEDGFICKIDRFVLYKACENIADRVKRGKICYPVSVNVSRVTAIQPDFADYYIRIKNKFNIKDGFITLEFTESFAYENYEYLSEIVGRLHDNGFLCSIDDFGTGYSSYNILKTIAMDEIKLDKFFLEKGLDEERDRMLLKSVVEMIKRLGMKVTQEGVESRESFELMQTLGCDVIQGYLFAKPMKYVDYCEFIDNNFDKSERAIKPDEKP